MALTRPLQRRLHKCRLLFIVSLLVCLTCLSPPASAAPEAPPAETVAAMLSKINAFNPETGDEAKGNGAQKVRQENKKRREKE